MYRPITKLLQILVHQYFLNPRCFILIKNTTKINIAFSSGNLATIIYINNNISVIRDTVTRNLGCVNFIINVREPAEVFEAIEYQLRETVGGFSHRKYLILDTEVLSKASFKVFKTKSISFVSNVVLIRIQRFQEDISKMVPNDGLNASFWIHPFRRRKNYNKPFILDWWFSHNNSFKFGKHLFWDKMHNLQGRTIKAGTFEFFPHAKKDYSAKVNFSGIDIQVIEEYAKFVNANLKIKIPDQAFWGYVFDNRTRGGIRGELYDDNIDIGAAGLFLSYQSVKVLEATVPFHFVDIKLLVPAPRLLAPWFTPFNSMSFANWGFCLFSFACIALTTILVAYFEKGVIGKKLSMSTSTIRNGIVFTSFATTFKLLVRQGVSSSSILNRALLGLVLLSTILILGTYDAGYASALTKQHFQKSIDTFDDFLDSDLKWVTIDTAEWIVKWGNTSNEKLKNAYKRFVKADAKTILSMADEGTNAIILNKMSDRYYLNPFIKSTSLDHYRLMNERLSCQMVVQILRKNSIFTPSYNYVIFRLLEAGIISYWVQQIPMKRENDVNHKIELWKNEKSAGKYQQLHVIHLIGTFYILGIGLFMATVVFIVECISCKAFKK